MKLGLTEASQYSLTITIFLIISGVSSAVMHASVPRLSSLMARRQTRDLAGTYWECVIISTLVFIFLAAGMILFGPAILSLVGSQSQLLPILYTFLLGIIFLLEMNHSIASIFITTANKVPFAMPSLISGCCIFCLSLILCPRLGLVGLLVSQAAIQLLYNNWKWPFVAMKLTDTNIRSGLSLGTTALASRLKIKYSPVDL